MANLDLFKMSKSQMNSISGGMRCRVTYSDGSWRYRIVNTTQSRAVTAAELTAQGMGAYSVSC